MAARKTTDLTPLTAPTVNTLVSAVDLTEALPANQNKKLTLADLTKGLSAATTGAAGVAQLSTSTSSTSTTLAATPSAVKAAYDAATTPATTSVAGIVQLSSATNSTSTTLAATPSAVKVAYDAASTAVGRNRLINGAMSIDQRNAGAAQTITAGAALAYTVDRWYGYCTGANVTGQRVAGSGADQFRYRFTGAASVSAIGFGQRIEQLNSYDLNGTTATLSVDLANSLLTTVTWTAFYANTADTFGTLASPTRTQIATGTFTVTSTVTRYSTQISIPAAATTGIEIVFTVGAQTSGTWTIGNVQLEAGTVATPIERRHHGMNIDLCQRYFERKTHRSTGAKYANGAGDWHGGDLTYSTKRIAPTITLGTSTLSNCSSPAVGVTELNTAGVSVTTSGAAQYNMASLVFSASAEL